MTNMALDWVHPISSHIETLLIFKENKVIHILGKDQMDALLDSEMGLPDMNGTYRAVFIQANYDWLIQALVCCTIPFDEAGYCERDWPLPLQRLCDSAGPGPDFGAGRIRLACRSQCPISGYKENLWDPSTAIFSAITEALDESQGTLLHQVTGDEFSTDEVTNIKRTLRNEEAAYRNQVQQLQQELEQQKLLAERLAKQLSVIMEKRSTLDEHELRQQNERLNMKVREQQVLLEKLRNEAPLQSSEDESLSDVDDSIIQRMQDNDVMSVVFHPGAGHINLSAHQLVDYLDDPIAYVAHHISLGKTEYLIWLKHHDDPHCAVCDSAISIIGDPAIFDENLDIYCEQHKPLE
jgi:hypothetical protein